MRKRQAVPFRILLSMRYVASSCSCCSCFSAGPTQQEMIPGGKKSSNAVAMRPEHTDSFSSIPPPADNNANGLEQHSMAEDCCCWATLAPEILSLAFRALDGHQTNSKSSGAARLVCVHWNAVLTSHRRSIFPRYCGHQRMLQWLERFPGLQHVDLTRCTAGGDSLIQPLSALSSLTSLAAPGCQLLTARGIAGLGPRLRSRLINLNLSGCSRIGDQALAEITQFTALCRLDLSGCRAITDHGLSGITLLAGLTELRISQCPRLTDHSLQSVCQLQQLRCLALANCREVTDSGVKMLGRLCLNHLDLSGCFVSDEALAPQAESLREILLRGCQKVDGSFLRRLRVRDSLQVLHLAGTALSDTNLTVLCREFSSIRRLSVAQCHKISSSGVQELGGLKAITDLDLSNCSASADSILRAVCPHKQLTALSLRGCESVDNEMLSNIVLNGPSCLRSLNLGGCQRISDEGAKHLTCMQSLTALNLQYCDATSDESIADLARRLPALAVLATDRICENNLTRFTGARVFKRL